ncbi:coiled-coil domain-containing protein 186-like isoform X2 [Littorina saxatilis]|uniref:Coiled-coil domain-containing protein 186 n=1 Tax=Littorina saxatilis TaxID=31220 RepID=A0AAN9GIF3_9CAEN
MSDPEAGDSEGAENPEPEDDAHLSSLPNTSSTDHRDALINQADTPRENDGEDEALARAEAPAQACEPESDLSESQQNGGEPLCLSDESRAESELSESQQNGSSDCGAGEAETVACAENSTTDAVCNKDGALQEGKNDQQLCQGGQLTPESDTCDNSGSASKDAGEAEGAHSVAEVSGPANSSPLHVQQNQSSGCDARDQPVNRGVNRGSTTDSSDQEESPPEDELFAAAPHPGAPPEDEQFVAEACPAATENSAPTEDELLSVVNSPANAHNNTGEDGGENVSMNGASSNLSVCCANMQQEEIPSPDSNVSTEAESSTSQADANSYGRLVPETQPSPQNDREEASKLPDKDSDQIPECDRGQSPRSSPSCRSPAAPENSTHAASSAQSAPRISSTIEQHAHSDEGLHVPSQASRPFNTEAPSETVNKKQQGAGDSSSDCDSNSAAASVQDEMSSQTTNSAQATITAAAAQGDASSKKLSFLDDDSDDEDLLTELDAELHLRCSPRRQQNEPVRLPLNGLKDFDPKHSELCKRFEEQLLQLQETVLQREREINRLKDEKNRQRQVSQEVITERDRLKAQLAAVQDRNPDDLYIPQIKELEYTITKQQAEIRQLKEKLTSHDSAAKRAINTLQSELKARMDQITKAYEETCREKDQMVVMFAQAETKNIEAKCAADKLESRVRDLLKEKEFNNNKTRAAVVEKQKAVLELQAKTGEVGALKKEMEKVKEEMQSMEYRVKWFQNKLKTELESHKETKTNLDKTTAKLKEAREETEMIRRDCQAIVKTYQESEEVRSNSLDKELKIKQTELMMKVKEKSETEEIHLRTKRELESLKSQHKDAVEELKTLKDKVQCLEEERLQAEQVQNKYQTIIQNQKSDNAGLSKQVTDHQTLKEDFSRAQEMIKTLDHEMSELKLNNRDLQKDIEGCQARESKMLTLQSELSRTNALLRSENTNLNNKVATLSGETQKMKMDIQDLETRCRNLTDEFEEEQQKRQEETSTLTAQLEVRTKESEDYKQKWEDEIDSNKTWKRKHANNVKDLTRQLQHAKKRLEAYENGSGNGERDANSMGSRTNSNGSLNSIDNSAQHNTVHHGGHQHNHHPPNAQSRGPSQEPEFPVITEQVEVDKQMLIERIVRLQRSLARKNEKLEFLEEHIQQLVLEIKKKNRIIQNYVVREESGTLASDVMDANKALLARKGGIMASVYSQHQQDGTMTMDLSLEINKKLQAVLEDTLLKNMTLKENLDTLGAEIARLSQENRRLQLHLQGVH